MDKSNPSTDVPLSEQLNELAGREHRLRLQFMGSAGQSLAVIGLFAIAWLSRWRYELFSLLAVYYVWNSWRWCTSFGALQRMREERRRLERMVGVGLE